MTSAILIDKHVAAGRVRAAIGFSGKTHEELETPTGIETSTMRRIVARSNPRGAQIEELWAIADACEVPRAFMEHGWDVDRWTQPAQSVNERLHALEEAITSLSQAVAQRVTSRSLEDSREELLRLAREAAQQVAQGAGERTAETPDPERTETAH